MLGLRHYIRLENILLATTTDSTKKEYAAPEPLCRIHGLRITACRPCYMTIFEEADFMSAEARHQWAIRNIYV